MRTASPYIPFLVATVLPTIQPFPLDAPPGGRHTKAPTPPSQPSPAPPALHRKEWPHSSPLTPPRPMTGYQQQQQLPASSRKPLDITPMMVPGSSLLEGRWFLASSNDVKVKHPLLVEIHSDQTFRLLGRKRTFAFSLRFLQAGKFDLRPLQDGRLRKEKEENTAEGMLVLYPESEHLESVAGVSLPVPEPDSAPPDPADLLKSPRKAKKKRPKTRRVRVVMEDRDTIILVFSDMNRFYVLQRSSGAEPDGEAHQNTPIYALVTTNILGWVISNLLAIVGDDINHWTHMGHIFH